MFMRTFLITDQKYFLSSDLSQSNQLNAGLIEFKVNDGVRMFLQKKLLNATKRWKV